MLKTETKSISNNTTHFCFSSLTSIAQTQTHTKQRVRSLSLSTFSLLNFLSFKEEKKKREKEKKRKEKEKRAEMSEPKDPAIKLFGKTIPVAELPPIAVVEASSSFNKNMDQDKSTCAEGNSNEDGGEEKDGDNNNNTDSNDKVLDFV